MDGLAEIVRLDQDLTLAINSLHCPFTDGFWQFFSNREVWYVMYLAIAVFLVVRLGWKRGLLAILTAVLALVACDQLANLVKHAVARPRPCHTPWMVDNGLRVLEGKGSRYGFFSAHAANAVSLAVVTITAFRLGRKKGSGRSSRRGAGRSVGQGSWRGVRQGSWRGVAYDIWICVWAFLVSASRIFVGKHYLGDVLVGILAGLAVGLLLSRVLRIVAGK